ncbi:MAG: hypothetical protein HQL90_05160 [Magnetococcales bacterium]|nr:hypothetical protein [Magnetococcales bacterium]
MNTNLLKYGVLLFAVTLLSTACAPLHPSGDLVEKGTIRVEGSGTKELNVTNVQIYSDTDGTHIHGKFRNPGRIDGHIEITLQDKGGTVLYQGTMVSSHRHTTGAGKNVSFIHEESFHLIVQVPVPEQGTLRVIFHPGPPHDMK